MNDFFSKQKKNTKQQAAKPAPSQSKDEPEAREQKPEETKQPKRVDDYESSDEEKTDLHLDSNINVMDKATLDAQKRKKQQEEEQESGATGWRAIEKQAKGSEQTNLAAKPKSLSGATAGSKASGGNINFSKSGPPKFSKQTKANAIKLDEEFPELGAPETSKPVNLRVDDSQQSLSKKDNANIDMLRAGAREARPAPTEEKKEATMPKFTRKTKLVGGDNVE